MPINQLRLRLDDGSIVWVEEGLRLGNIISALCYGPDSVGGDIAKRKGFSYFAGEWHIPTSSRVSKPVSGTGKGLFLHLM